VNVLTEEQHEIHEKYILFLKKTWEHPNALNKLDRKDLQAFITSKFSLPIHTIQYSESLLYGIGTVSSLQSFYIPPELKNHRELFDKYIDATGHNEDELGATTSETNILSQLFTSGKILSVNVSIDEYSNTEINPSYIIPDNNGQYVNIQNQDKIVRTIQNISVNVLIPYKSPQLFDNNKKLHSLKRAAKSSFLDGNSYYIHGVSFLKEDWELIKDRKMTIEKVLKLSNVEQRRVALELYGPNIIVKNSRLLDESARGNKLYKFSIQSTWSDGFHIHILQYKDSSSKRVYNSFVPPTIDKADAGMAWKFNITEEEYMELKVER